MQRGGSPLAAGASSPPSTAVVELQGMQFPSAVRSQGTSVELVRGHLKEISSWAEENRLASDRQWGIISKARSKNEELFLALGFRKVTRTTLVLRDGRIERKQEETTEPEVGEFHLRRDGLLELYSCGPRLKSAILRSLGDSFGKDSLEKLYLPKESMNKLMEEAIEILSVSFSGLGNPFFSDATLSGADPVNSKTCKEFMSSGELKSFRAKFSVASPSSSAKRDGDGEDSSDILMATVYNGCKLRFFPGQGVQAQSDIEEFVSRVQDVAATASQTAE